MGIFGPSPERNSTGPRIFPDWVMAISCCQRLIMSP
jgi:hypothetical protein